MWPLYSSATLPCFSYLTVLLFFTSNALSLSKHFLICWKVSLSHLGLLLHKTTCCLLTNSTFLGSEIQFGVDSQLELENRWDGASNEYEYFVPLVVPVTSLLLANYPAEVGWLNSYIWQFRTEPECALLGLVSEPAHRISTFCSRSFRLRWFSRPANIFGLTRRTPSSDWGSSPTHQISFSHHYPFSSR